MADLTLTLGGVTFSGFEIPEYIDVALRQARKTHRLIGGTRVVDAMGADYEPILWSGRFRGANAEARARQLEAMAAAGGEHDLSWSGYYYRVLITGFRAKFERRYEIPYQIECEVVSAPGGGGGGSIQSIDQVIGPDLAALAGLGTAGPLAGALADVAAVQAASGPLASLSNIGLTPMRTAVFAAADAAAYAVTAGDTGIEAAQTVPDHIPVADGAAIIALACVDAIRDQADLVDAAALIGRVSSNLVVDQATRG